IDRMYIVSSIALGLRRPYVIPKDEFTCGYLAFLFLSFAIALCLWTLLRIPRLRVKSAVLKEWAGILAVAALPSYWLLASFIGRHRYGWNPLRAAQTYEVAAVVICVLLSLHFVSRIFTRCIFVVILLHYAFWFWQFGTYHGFF